MDWQAALLARLEAAAEVAALVADRVHWIERPQRGGLPAITLLTVSDGREQHFGGFHGTQMARVQADIWAARYAEARAIAEAAITALAPAHEGNGVSFARGFVDRLSDSSERLGDQTIFRVSIDFIIHHATA